MKTVTIAFLVLSALSINGAWAHEGHDKTPGAIAAPHGGITQGTNSLYWELVKESSVIRLYPLTHDMTPILPKEIGLTGNIIFPKKTKGEAVKFSAESDHFSASVDAKGAYRYTLEISFIYKSKKEKVKFQIEPQN